MASENGNGSSKHRTSDEDNSSHYSRSSSSSYASSASLSSKSNSLESDVDEKNQISPTKSENENIKSSPAEWSMMSVSPRAGYSQSELPQNYSVSSTVSPPPVQTMGRFPGYDPNRIPSSVFGTNKPTGNTEWSVASTESLFSIQMGNNSFTRDQFNFLKSGELKSPDEFIKSMSGLPPITETSTNELHGLPVVNEAASENVTGRESIECEEVEETKNNETVMAVDKIRLSISASNVSDNQGENQGMPHTPSGASDGSRTSNGSFAFPVLGGETPSKSPIKKPNVQQQQQQQQETPEEPHKPAETKWFACFSCCPFCK